jgi:hypothetical protein
MMNLLIGGVTTTPPGKVDLTAGWNTIYADYTHTLGTPLSNLMIAVGTLLVVGGVLKWLWDRKRSGNMGGQGAHGGLLWTIIIGATLTSPGVLIPFFLTFTDFIINALINL